MCPTLKYDDEEKGASDVAFTVTRRLRLRAAVVLALTLTLLGIPAMAQAAFTAYAGAATPVSTATIPAPTTAVAATCQTQSQTTVKIDVGAYTRMPFANRHEIVLYDPAGAVKQTKSLLGADGGDITLTNPYGQSKGTWRYELRGYYDVPGTANTWTGAARTGTVTCT
ncbi:hypothetical protein [Arthrobacter sp. USHLN218]|uniref:hypothetical protein n=1 Tax=Arthrobacter sp. USHLN218 TaxID=3081232 RepID=UPI00301B689E